MGDDSEKERERKKERERERESGNLVLWTNKEVKWCYIHNSKFHVFNRQEMADFTFQCIMFSIIFQAT